ncbi:MAG: MinD/ParA family protein, partial [Deltaproteobacteria bacterium]|nr:MinD/ParA family protein [Deltaproteobacteria bacterium]
MENKKTKIITISSGKGGVGKTCIALNLALGLIKGGHRVCLLDADLGLANVDVLLGISPEHSLMEYIEDRCALDDLLIKGPDGLGIIPGGSGLDRLPQLKSDEKEKLADILPLLQDNDELIIDTAAGISDIVLHFLDAATIPVIVIIPEPTSLTDAYSLLKTYCGRGYHGPVYILLNRVKSAGHAKGLFNKFNAVVRKYLDISIKPIGFVLFDEKVQEAVKEQTPFMNAFPDSLAGKSMQRIAHTVSQNHHILPNEKHLDQLFFSNQIQQVSTGE